jgi:hypothetical protein
MSTKKHYTKLEGHEGPYFPEGIDTLNEAYGDENKFVTTGADLDKMGRSLTGFVEQNRPATEDGYTWFWAQTYSTMDRNGKMIVLFPWSQDWKKRNRTQADRSIAFYKHGEVTIEELSGLAAVLARTITKGETTL